MLHVLHQYTQRTCKGQLHMLGTCAYVLIRMVKNFHDMSWYSVGTISCILSCASSYWYRNDGMLFTFPMHGMGDMQGGFPACRTGGHIHTHNPAYFLHGLRQIMYNCKKSLAIFLNISKFLERSYFQAQPLHFHNFPIFRNVWKYNCFDMSMKDKRLNYH